VSVLSVRKLKDLSEALTNLFTRRNARYNRALREILRLQKLIEEVLAKYHIQEKQADFRLLFDNIGQARIDITEIAHLAGEIVKLAKDIEGKNLRSLLEALLSDLEDFKRGLFTRTLRGSALSERLLSLHNSLENLLGAISAMEYR